MVARTRLNITLYVQYIACLVLIRTVHCLSGFGTYSTLPVLFWYVQYIACLVLIRTVHCLSGFGTYSTLPVLFWYDFLQIVDILLILYTVYLSIRRYKCYSLQSHSLLHSMLDIINETVGTFPYVPILSPRAIVW